MCKQHTTISKAVHGHKAPYINSLAMIQHGLCPHHQQQQPWLMEAKQLQAQHKPVVTTSRAMAVATLTSGRQPSTATHKQHVGQHIQTMHVVPTWLNNMVNNPPSTCRSVYFYNAQATALANQLQHAVVIPA
jgi:hypothetical protein